MKNGGCKFWLCDELLIKTLLFARSERQERRQLCWSLIRKVHQSIFVRRGKLIAVLWCGSAFFSCTGEGRGTKELFDTPSAPRQFFFLIFAHTNFLDFLRNNNKRNDEKCETWIISECVESLGGKLIMGLMNFGLLHE